MCSLYRWFWFLTTTGKTQCCIGFCRLLLRPIQEALIQLEKGLKFAWRNAQPSEMPRCLQDGASLTWNSGADSVTLILYKHIATTPNNSIKRGTKGKTAPCQQFDTMHQNTYEIWLRTVSFERLLPCVSALRLAFHSVHVSWFLKECQLSGFSFWISSKRLRCFRLPQL